MAQPKVKEIATLHVLSLPEILQVILAHAICHDEPKTFEVRLVNKQWAAIGNDILWQYACPSALLNIPSDQRQPYASKMKQLHFVSHGPIPHRTFDPCHGQFGQLTFPKVESVVVYPTGGEETIVPWNKYLQPRLEHLNIQGDPLTLSIMDSLVQRCSNLRFLSCVLDSNESAFIGCVKVLPSLADLRVTTINMSPTWKFFAFLFSLDKLQGLSVRDPCCARHSSHGHDVLGMKLFNDIVAKHPYAFQHFEYLDVKITSSTVESLVDRLKKIRSLKLEVPDDDCDILKPLAKLEALKELSIVSVKRDGLTTNHSLVALRDLHNLADLDYRVYRTESDPWTYQIGDYLIAELSSGMPKLRHLGLHVPGQLTISSLNVLARNCRNIQSVFFEGSFELIKLYDSGPEVLFPELRTLALGEPQGLPDGAACLFQSSTHDSPPAVEQSTEEQRAAVELLVDRLAGSAPRLEHFYLSAAECYSASFKKMIETDFRTRYGPPCCRHLPEDDDDDMMLEPMSHEAFMLADAYLPQQGILDSGSSLEGDEEDIDEDEDGYEDDEEEDDDSTIETEDSHEGHTWLSDPEMEDDSDGVDELPGLV